MYETLKRMNLINHLDWHAKMDPLVMEEKLQVWDPLVMEE